jgi:hypothetical protein
MSVQFIYYNTDQRHVKIIVSSLTDVGILSATDGWGDGGVTEYEGNITIFAWNFHGQTQRFRISDLISANFIAPYPNVSTSNHFLSVQVIYLTLHA